MRGSLSAPRWVVLLALGAIAALHLACLIPSSVSNPTETPTVSPTSPPLASLPATTPEAGPTTSTIVARISEADLNESLRETQTLGEGLECRDIRLRVQRSGLTLSTNVEIARLWGLPIPVEVLLQPVVHEERVQLEVLDVQLGGPYALMSGFVKPALTAGIAGALEVEGLPVQPGWQVSEVELEDGYLVVTTVPDR